MSECWRTGHFTERENKAALEAAQVARTNTPPAARAPVYSLEIAKPQ